MSHERRVPSPGDNIDPRIRIRVVPSRAKKHKAWEQHELVSHGFYGQHLEQIALFAPTLTRSELRVAALVSGLLSTAEIARILGLQEHSVENYKTRIRKKLQVPEDVQLPQYLMRIILSKG